VRERRAVDSPAGLVPRGYVGAFGRLGAVKVVLLLAEPGNSLPEIHLCGRSCHGLHGTPAAGIEQRALVNTPGVSRLHHTL
jgi:hypothetical protein